MKSIKSQIPNAVTLLNAFFGCCAIVSLFQHAYSNALLFIAFSMFADYLDGFVARLLNVTSELGLQLDSLSDAVSFGIVPGTIIYCLLKEDAGLPPYAVYAGFFITVFSLYRLAKFNIDTRQRENFVGLNTPANTLFFSGLLIMHIYKGIQFSSTLLLLLISVSCFLLVSEVPMFSFKFKNFSWAGNEMRFSFLFIALLLFLWIPYLALPIIIGVYIGINIIAYSQKNKNISKEFKK